MPGDIAACLTEYLISEQIIDREKENIYIYGFKLFLSTMSSTFSILFISALTHTLMAGCLFLIIFLPLRMTANGYHASTFFKCFLLTNTVFGIYVYMLSQYPVVFSGKIDTIIFMSSVICICTKAPVEHPNHKLSEGKRKKNRHYAYIILGIDGLVIVLLKATGHQKAVFSIGMSIVIVAIMMLIKNKEEKNECFISFS